MSRPAPTCKNHRYPIEVVVRAVWLYLRFNLSLQNVEEMLLERGIAVSYEMIRRWRRKHGSDYARRLRRKAPAKDDVWHLDELVARINGRKCWLWRAVYQDGYVLDENVQARRKTKAARRLLMRLLKKQGLSPKRMVTDKLRSYGAARRQVMPNVEHRSHKAFEQQGRELRSAVPKTKAGHAGLLIDWFTAAVRFGFLRSPQSLRSSQIKQVRHPDPKSSHQRRSRMDRGGAAAWL